MRASIPALKRAVTRLIHEELAMAALQADFEEGQASASDMQWQQRNLRRARSIYDQRLQILEEQLPPSLLPVPCTCAQRKHGDGWHSKDCAKRGEPRG